MKVCACCILKMENKYIREWVEHYKSIGCDNVILYDNNDLDGEKLEDVIEDYIDNGFAIIENAKGKQQYQCIAFRHCFDKYRKNYDWICLLDADELLSCSDVKTFLNNEKFQSFNCVRVCWRLFDDSNIVEANGDYSMLKRFNTYRNCRQCKSIINTKFDIRSGFSPHGPLNVNCCDVNGNKCWSHNEFIGETVSDKNYQVWINHYYMKTIDEFVTGKMVRLYPDQSKQKAQNTLQVERFFMFNELTQEKIEWLKNHGLELKMKDGHVDYIRPKSFYEEWFK